MKKFDILEHGHRVATIEARTPESALRKAAREFPRRAADYNVEPGDAVTTIEWRAFDVADPHNRAMARVTVPGRGTNGCEF